MVTQVINILDTVSGDRVLPLFLTDAAPVNGTSGTLAGVAQPGSLLQRSDSPALYQNTGSQASPTWTQIEAAGGTGDFVDLSASGSVTGDGFKPFVRGAGNSYKIARGVHTQVAASDTIVTGLATVVAVAVALQSAPTVEQMFVTGDIGDQDGAPDAGSFLLNSYKPTAVNDVTPIAATDFTGNAKINWIAIGT